MNNLVVSVELTKKQIEKLDPLIKLMIAYSEGVEHAVDCGMIVGQPIMLNNGKAIAHFTFVKNEDARKIVNIISPDKLIEQEKDKNHENYRT